MRVAFLGDVLLREETSLDGIRPGVEGADLLVVNLEGAVTARTQAAGRPGRDDWSYRMAPEAVGALCELGAGRVAAGLANNHVLDHGPDGLADTLAALDAAGIAHCGAGPDAARAARPLVVEAGGVRVGLLAAMARYRMYDEAGAYAADDRAGPHLLDEDAVAGELADLRAQADAVVMLAHWGRNYRPLTRRQRAGARVLREAGADLVVGHHPHVVHEVDVRDARCPVLFSLGNAAFGTRGGFRRRGFAPYGLLATAELTPGDGVTALELRLLYVDNREVNYRSSLVDDPDFLLSLVHGTAAWRHIPGGVRWER